MDNGEVERQAREIQKEIWRKRSALWPKEQPPLVRMFEPEIAAQVLGIQFERFGYLPWFEKNGVKHEVAGLIDRADNRIAVSTKFAYPTVRFTGAHEIGHWIMHEGEVMHRDRPIEGLSVANGKRPPIEQEADYFAACFLMPRKLVEKTFATRFSPYVPFSFYDDTAQLLRPRDPDSLLDEELSELDRAAVLASARKFGVAHFESLHETFGVSIGSMAIRLIELELVRD